MSQIRTDGLTGLQNREALEQMLQALLKQEDSIGLALLDVDHFKEVNDTFGHKAGDHVLQTIANLMQEKIKSGTCFRVSGDEFAVVFPGGTLEQSFLMMEALRTAVSDCQSSFQIPDDSGYEVSVTVGVAQFPRDAKDEPSLMNAADAALRAAKEGGRNQVALPPNEEMVMKSCYYPATMVRKLKILSDKLKKKESILLREALNDLLRKYDWKEDPL